jgi:hypothetical protein
MTPPLDLRRLRLGRCSEAIVAARHAVIKRAILTGFRRIDIARYLNVSEATVSRVGSIMLQHPL